MRTTFKVAALAVATGALAKPSDLVTRQSGGAFVPKPGYFPATGDDVNPGGIFCFPLAQLAPWLAQHNLSSAGGGSETPRQAGVATSGSGPYPATTFTDPTLPKHTIFAPKTPPPKDVVLPFISFANGFCGPDPTPFKYFLTEIASYGYVIAADGTVGNAAGQTMVSDSRASVDWATKGSASKYGNVDPTMITTMGQSCGGLEALSTAYHDDRVKRAIMLNIATFLDERRYLLQEIKIPLAWFVGGKTDMGFENANKDYKLLNAGLPAYKASLDTGHSGTYTATNGGKFGKAVVAYLEWQWRKNATAKAILTEPTTPGSLVSDKWTVEFKNQS